MTVNSFEISESLQLRKLHPDRALTACHESDVRIWINLQTADSHEIEDWLNQEDFMGENLFWGVRPCHEGRPTASGCSGGCERRFDVRA